MAIVREAIVQPKGDKNPLPRSKKINNQQHHINNIALANTASAQGTSLYIIGLLNLRRFCVFAPKIGDFERKIGANDMRKLLHYNNFRVSVFFLKKVFACRRLRRRFYLGLRIGIYCFMCLLLTDLYCC